MIILGGFLVFMGLIGVWAAADEGIGWLRREPDADVGGAIFGLGVAVVFIPLGYLAIRYRGADWTLGPTGERVALGVLGLAIIVGAVVIWILAPRVGQDSGDPVDEVVHDVMSEGPAEAVTNAIWRTLGLRRSSVVLAMIGALVASGVVWPSIPRHLYAVWLVTVDAIELFGYGAADALPGRLRYLRPCAWVPRRRQRQPLPPRPLGRRNRPRTGVWNPRRLDCHRPLAWWPRRMTSPTRRARPTLASGAPWDSRNVTVALATATEIGFVSLPDAHELVLLRPTPYLESPSRTPGRGPQGHP
jgi:hypothetical protein